MAYSIKLFYIIVVHQPASSSSEKYEKPAKLDWDYMK